MIKRFISGFLAAGLVIGSLSGCGVSTDTGATQAAGGSTESGAEAVKATGTEEQITWMFWDNLDATEDLISKGYKQVIDRFNE